MKKYTEKQNDFRTVDSGPIHVLLVEDDDDLRQSLTDFLCLHSLSVTPVANGAEFQRAFEAETFDVAIIDVNLPDINGFEIAGILTRSRNLGVIILTALNMRDDKIRGYTAGANLYFTKPVDGDELVLATRNLARRLAWSSELSKPTTEASAVWTIDVEARRLVSSQGVFISLSGREATLVLRLAQEVGRVVSRAELNNALGYQEVSPENRSLDAVLRRLRLKAREVGLELPVHVVHAAGFQFSAEVVFK